MRPRLPSRLLASLSFPVPPCGPSSSTWAARALATAPARLQEVPEPLLPPSPPPSLDGPSSSSSASAASGPEPASLPTASPLRLTVPEADGQRRLGSTRTTSQAPGTSERDVPTRPGLTQRERRNRKALKKRGLASDFVPTTDVGRIIAAAPYNMRAWGQVLTTDILTLPQKLEYLADPALHGAPIPEDHSPDMWYTFADILHKHLNRKNPLLRPTDDVRAAQLRLGVTRILQHQKQRGDPHLLLHLLRLCSDTTIHGSTQLFKMLAAEVRQARSGWWLSRDAPEVRRLVRDKDKISEVMLAVDGMHRQLYAEGIADAWNQSLCTHDVRFHRRRLYRFKKAISDPSLIGMRKTDSAEYVTAFIHTSGSQCPHDPVLNLLMLQCYLLMAPDPDAQSYFDSIIAFLPDIAADWTPQSSRQVREQIEDCPASDIDMYLETRSCMRGQLRPYLGALFDLWQGVFPLPQHVGRGIISRADRARDFRRDREAGLAPYGAGGALDFNEHRTPRLSRAERAQRKVELDEEDLKRHLRRHSTNTSYGLIGDKASESGSKRSNAEHSSSSTFGLRSERAPRVAGDRSQPAL